ncbi:DUF1257 domain-containing protein [Dactylosporangium matsuzakiense]|uniref:DUF1257 domain-containing protein n=1 Tax=Dactylosporangium matsuzakiense TaxID=53360 RepID=A0A9W6NTT1_9ACTN|nr:DUF1257 domain-containing protein [Dactylosporangium matsuzakiense]UWZ47916.1 DUF1257 domain-containing protein [Dactylosporangium matsuzakiense]GLL08547.1 hypothetical protein GCM10017581_103140 [Dactylosporangium matsuzakiense]
MSHFTRVRTALRDADLLVEALAAVGYPNAERHDEPTTLFGYQGDRRPETAEVIVRRAYISGASNDIGFRRTADGTFDAVISDFDRRRHDTAWLHRLTQQYGRAATLHYAEHNGFDVTGEEHQPDGSIRLLLRRTA